MLQEPSFQKSLLVWYRKNRRDLPWRRTSDPYQIWVSEIMLQQTTVEAVIPYYGRFLKRFVTLQDLARAEEDEVVGLWSGLGYYSRARNLHRAAKMVCEKFGGNFPKTVEELKTLPGIGRYTAGAVASIAFEERAPILDGNVIRVLSRLFVIGKNPKTSEGQKIFWKKAEEILPQKSLGDFNQALMELGATLCIPEKPLCLLCPLSSFCQAKKRGKAEDFPKGKKKTVYRDVMMSAALIEKDGKILMRQRSGKGFLKGMWEVPMVEGGEADLKKQWPVRVQSSMPIVRHSIMNRKIQVKTFICHLDGSHLDGSKMEGPSQWITPEMLMKLPTSSMNQKIIRQFVHHSVIS